jgi:hypothetical protein
MEASAGASGGVSAGIGNLQNGTRASKYLFMFS